MTFLIALEAGHFPLGGAVTGDVTLFLAIEAAVSATLGAFAREVSFFAAFKTLGGSSAGTTSSALKISFIFNRTEHLAYISGHRQIKITYLNGVSRLEKYYYPSPSTRSRSI